jgi:acetyl-CoA carboxylase biotin carboxyl carrier protein
MKLMDINEIKTLVELLDQSSLNHLELKNAEFEILLKKPMLEKNIDYVKEVAHEEGSASKTVKQQPLVEQEEIKHTKTTNVLSPLVGVFYQASSPEAGLFVTIGQTVKEGETLCIIEAMKILNEIKAPVSGKITKINVKNADIVEYGQVLMEIGEEDV